MPTTPYPITANELRWLYIDFNSYFASVEQQRQPHLRGKPVVIVPVETDSTSAIAASYEAKKFGIRTGTPIYEAKKMCPGLICILANHEYYVDFHQRILKEIDNHIPVTAVCSIDEMACRLMDNEISVERSTAIAQSIKNGLAKNIGEYVKCSIGIAPNKYLAKVATDLHKPDGLTILKPEDLPGRLLSLKLRDLPGVGYNIEQRLLMAGIHTITDVWNLNPHQMRKIWGSIWGEKMWYFIRGIHIEDEETTRSTIGHSHVMAPDLREPSKAKHVARRLVLKAASRLRRMNYYASALSLSARIENGPRITIGERCWRAQDSNTFTHMLDRLWVSVQKEAKGKRIKKVSVTLHELEPASDLLPELFAELPGINLKERLKSERMSHAMDKINHKFGRDSVLLGMMPSDGRSLGTSKIAFNRIPDMEEFVE